MATLCLPYPSILPLEEQLTINQMDELKLIKIAIDIFIKLPEIADDFLSYSKRLKSPFNYSQENYTIQLKTTTITFENCRDNYKNRGLVFESDQDFYQVWLKVCGWIKIQEKNSTRPVVYEQQIVKNNQNKLQCKIFGNVKKLYEVQELIFALSSQRYEGIIPILSKVTYS